MWLNQTTAHATKIVGSPSAEVPARTEQRESRPQRIARRMVTLAVMMDC